jgi:hypothetical protein
MHEAEDGDTYIHDGLHYQLSVEEKLIVTEPHEQHSQKGQWWWAGNIPADVVIEDFYLSKN